MRPPSAIGLVHVVVPAHDEEERIGRALAALAVAVDRARAAHPGLRVGVTVVLDRCRDATAQVARSCGVETVEVDAGTVGGARRAGVDHVVRTADVEPDRVWVLGTDADSVVPETWVLDHLRLAEHHDVVVGAARPDPGETTPRDLAEWERRHAPGELRVYGANLGFRLSTYLRTGGFEDLAQHEDVALLRAFTTLGVAIAAGSEVLTSSRHVGRTPGGFSGYMALLAAEVVG